VAAAGGGAIASSYVPIEETVAVDAHSATDPASFTARHATQGPGWLSADMGFAVRLPDNRVAWFYGDTVTGSATPDGRLEHMDGFLRNTIVVQDGTKLTTLATRQADGLHGSLEPQGHPGEWYWPGSPVVDGDHVRLVAGRVRQTESGAPGWTFEGTGHDLVTLSAHDLSVESVVPLTDSANISWGAGMVVDGGHELITGTKLVGYDNEVFLSRVPRAGAGGTPKLEVWNGRGWTTDQAAAKPITTLVGAQLLKTAGGWAMVGQDGIFSPKVAVRTAPSLTGPWSDKRVIAEVPHADHGEIFYTPTVHPEFDAGGKVLISTSVNSDDGQLHPELDRYRPRFVSVDESALEPR
jgi:hypothetical protein